MAVTVSGWFVVPFIDILDGTQLAVDLTLETHKAALFTNSITPDYGADTAYGAAPYNANEIANGGGYTTGGALITSTEVDQSPAGTLRWDAADTSWASSTIAVARCALCYADALAGNNAILLVDFDADYSTSNGTFTIQWPSTGIGGIDLTP